MYVPVGVVFIGASKLAIVDTISISQLLVCSAETSGMVMCIRLFLRYT